MFKVKAVSDRVVLTRTTTDPGTGKETVTEFSVSVSEAHALLHGPMLLEALVAAKEHTQKVLIDRAAALEKEARQLRQSANAEAEKERLRRMKEVVRR